MLPPSTLVGQDECAVNANDDCPYEWCEAGRMSLKSKSRGALLMVSDYLSEWRGRLRCTAAQAAEYAAEFPDSLIAQKFGHELNPSDAGWELDARLILEPGAGAGKDE